ncbi:MAG: prepilin-type N-terminal cleavage/methylation domain-containing protein, partial [Candidatus Omnitrophica bacterium]|nr:prepilin-type N-terminal cleavage/methylation domain-containing protein [Candidatus Omnitrophota bacterium]
MADRFLNGSKYIFGLFRTPTLNQVRGFTLIELLIVIAIILILIAIALPKFLEAQVRAKIAKAKGEMRTLGIAMDS